MTFTYPAALAGLLLVPAAIAIRELARARARRYALRFPAVATLALAAGEGAGRWRRRVPAALLLAALAALVIAAARPHRAVAVPVGRASVMLVTDHSGSMDATDIQPTRLAAANAAAHAFVGQLPRSVSLGVVTFAGATDAVLAPTPDHGRTLRIIDNQAAVGATATGDALQVALAQLHASGAHPPSAIVLLSDGSTTTGSDPIAVAHDAATHRIPIYTVSLGTDSGTVSDPNGSGQAIPVPPDPGALRSIAQASNGAAYTASDTNALGSIYKRLGTQLGTRHEQHEITASFAIGALVLLAAAAVTSLRFAGRLP